MIVGQEIEELGESVRLLNHINTDDAGNGDIRLMKEAKITDGGNLPDDYLAFCGAMPVKVIGKKVKFYISSTKPMATRDIQATLQDLYHVDVCWQHYGSNL